MGRNSGLIIAAATVATLASGACDNTKGPDRSGRIDNTPSGSSDSVTIGNASGTRASLTGCLRSGREGGMFVLQLASAGDLGGTTTAAGTSGAGTQGRLYRITSSRPNELAQHLNTRVSIDGYLQGPAETAAPLGTTGSSTEGATSGVKGSGGVSGASGVSGATGMTGTSGNRAPSDASGGSGGSSAATRSGNSSIDALPVMRAETVQPISDQCLAAEEGAANR